MDIPDEAVEAAAAVILSGTDAGYHAYKIAFAALEAAAPHMLAADESCGLPDCGWCRCQCGEGDCNHDELRSQT